MVVRVPLVLCALVLAGCGGGGPSDEEQVRETLTRFGRATAERDYRALCGSILAPRLVETVTKLGLSCELAMEKSLAGTRDPQLSIGAVQVRDGRASARVRTSAAGQAPSEDTVELIRVDGGWRIASLAGSGG